MKISDVRAMTTDQLTDELKSQKSTSDPALSAGFSGQLENQSRIRQVRRDIVSRSNSSIRTGSEVRISQIGVKG